jgi:hypothetical protein
VIVFKFQTEDKATIVRVQCSVSRVVLAAAKLMARNDPTTTNFRELFRVKIWRGSRRTHKNLASNTRFADFLIERIGVLKGCEFIPK